MYQMMYQVKRMITVLPQKMSEITTPIFLPEALNNFSSDESESEEQPQVELITTSSNSASYHRANDDEHRYLVLAVRDIQLASNGTEWTCISRSQSTS